MPKAKEYCSQNLNSRLLEIFLRPGDGELAGVKVHVL